MKNWSEKKVDVVIATVEVVAGEGLDKATTARIARHAGVGEGTIYRYFKSKEELIITAALYVSDIIFAQPRSNYDPELPVPNRYLMFCNDFLRTGSTLYKHHSFMEQFIDSPAGDRHRRESLLALEADTDHRSFIFPLNRILHDGLKQGVVKNLPLVVLVSLTLPPLTFILKYMAQSLIELSDEDIENISLSCWAAVRR